MKKTTLYTILSFLLLSCQQPADEISSQSVFKEPSPTIPMPDTTKVATSQRLIEGELQYYLKRHNVDDEGYDMVVKYHEQGNALMTAYIPQLPARATGMLCLRHVPRQGMGVKRDNGQRIVLGTWNADTLSAGISIDTANVYAGQFNRYGLPHGHGSGISVDETYFEGHFEHGLRQGFGMAVNTHSLLAGTWKNNRFLGERINHNSDRIYGIDISRYQHEQGRKKFAIDWKRMRITHLGSKSQNKGEAVDFPVSFVYIKATEGISINNRYFAADYAAAHRQGISVGAYHFFSTRQSARLQANYFISKAIFRHGDLPPMLDVEPTDALIRQMGGPEVLFREIRTWLEIVERKTGARPLLYVNQRFVKKYLPEAPGLKEKYQIWIARYSEYKPDVHLAIWQLTPEGRVSGIRGAVDINVFNGYAGQWEEFKHDEAIP